VRAFVLGFLGVQLGQVYGATAKYLDKFEDIVLIIIIAVVIGFVIFKKHKKTAVSR
jgi:membrane protein DedA with SNARE-associated domain